MMAITVNISKINAFHSVFKKKLNKNSITNESSLGMNII